MNNKELTDKIEEHGEAIIMVADLLEKVATGLSELTSTVLEMAKGGIDGR